MNAGTHAPRRGPGRWALIGAALIGVVAGALFGYWRGGVHGGGRPAPPVLGRAPAFTLTNQLGVTVNSRQFAGKVQVVTFLFPYCTSYCPIIATHLAALEQTLRQMHWLGSKVVLVTFNVDPAGAGPKQLRAFLAEYGAAARDPGWQFLTGTPAAIRRVVRDGYHVSYQRVSLAQENREIAREKRAGIYLPEPQALNPLADRAHVDYDVVHNDLMALVDARGRIRKLYQNADVVSEQRLIRAIGRLLPPGT
ncbi:MAG: SCO family protein [Gammaproteobacteria bacterium]|nr:SCO family protein [Gammaproteobacteria bacterium]